MFSLGRWLFSLLLCLLVIGFFRGWFSFSNPSRDTDTNKVNINVSVDTNKAKADAQKAEQFTEKVAQRLKERPDTAKAQAVK